MNVIVDDPRLLPLAERFPERNAGLEPPSGWIDLIVALDAELALLSPDYQILQVKEKFGGLRYYAGHAHSDRCGGLNPGECQFQTLINAAEEKSFSVCQECGRPGSLRDKHWIATLCDEHNVRGDHGYRSPPF